MCIFSFSLGSWKDQCKRCERILNLMSWLISKIVYQLWQLSILVLQLLSTSLPKFQLQRWAKWSSKTNFILEMSKFGFFSRAMWIFFCFKWVHNFKNEVFNFEKITSHILNHNFIPQNFDHSRWKDELLVYFYPNRYSSFHIHVHTHTYEVYEIVVKK
jgi:hypothetical protein